MVATAAYTRAQVERLTRRDVLTRFLRETNLGFTGTATGGSTSTIVDTTRLKSTQYADDEHIGKWARITYDAGGAGAAPEGEISPITDYVASTGTLTVNPVFTASPVSTDVYQVWSNPHPQDVLDHLDMILTQEVYLSAETLLTEIPDGDMEQNNTTDWANSNATVTKDTAEPSLSGVRWLKVVTTSANGYARSALIYVEPGQRYFVSVDVRADAASVTPTLIAYDETNSAAIDSKTAVRRNAVRLSFEFTVPATCYVLSVRLSNAENSATSFWDNAVLHPLQGTSIALPWWVRQGAQVKGIYRTAPNYFTSNISEAVLRGNRDDSYDIRDDAFGRGQLRLQRRYGMLPPEPLFIKGTRNETAFSSENSDVKHIDGNFIQAALAANVFQQLSAYPNSGFLNMDWIREKLVYWTTKYEREKYKQALRIEQMENAPQPDGLFYRNRSGSWDGERPYVN